MPRQSRGSASVYKGDTVAAGDDPEIRIEDLAAERPEHSFRA